MIAEPDIDKVRVTEGELDQAYADYQPVIEQAAQYSPGHAKAIKAIQALFDEAAFAARPVRAAVLANQSVRAMQLVCVTAWTQNSGGRDWPQLIWTTECRRRSIVHPTPSPSRRITPSSSPGSLILIGLGLSFALAFYIVQTAVVDELMSLRGSVQDVADGRLDQPIPFLDRTNEIGEMSRALRTLQSVARERDLQSWVKTEVAATALRLQSAEDFASFANRLLSRISESIELLYGALYIADDDHTRFARAGGFASITLENHGSLPRVRGWWTGRRGKAPLTVTTTTAIRSGFQPGSERWRPAT